MTLKELDEKKKKKKKKYVSSDSDIDEEDVEQLEVLLSRRFHKGKGISKVSYLSFILIVMRLVILLLDVQRRRTKEVVTNTKVEEMKTKRIIKTKARSLAKWMKRKQRMIRMNMVMK